MHNSWGAYSLQHCYAWVGKLGKPSTKQQVDPTLIALTTLEWEFNRCYFKPDNSYAQELRVHKNFHISARNPKNFHIFAIHPKIFHIFTRNPKNFHIFARNPRTIALYNVVLFQLEGLYLSSRMYFRIYIRIWGFQFNFLFK